METLHGLFQLQPHPDNPSHLVKHVGVTLTFIDAGQWSISFAVNPPEGIQMPKPAQPTRQDGLWLHTCFELFVLDPENGSYLEFNFSPSGCWAAYAFDNYRFGRRDLEIPAICVTTSSPEQFNLAKKRHLVALGIDEETIKAMLELDIGDAGLSAPVNFTLSAVCDAPGLSFSSNCRFAISAVIEEIGGTKSYWALAHPPGEPDFHHPTSYAATLPAPTSK